MNWIEMMDSQANYRLVGGFILFCSLALISSLLWLTNISEGRNSSFYFVYFRNHSLSGLQKDSYVTMRGIKVGSVVEYQISPKKAEEVRVTLRLDPGIPVTEGTEAIITRNLLTGLATVELSLVPDGGKALVESVDEEYPVIREGTSTLDQIADSLPDVVESLSSIAGRIHAVLSEENVQLLTSTLREIEALTKQANLLVGDVRTLSTDIASMTRSANELSTKSSQHVDAVAENFVSSLQQIRASFAELEQQTKLVSSSLLGTSQVISQQMVSLSQHINEATESISQTTETFENPSTILTGPPSNTLGPGEGLLPK